MATTKKTAKKATKKRKVAPRRQTVLHNDGSIENAVKQIEKVFNLPVGSVRLEYKSGRKARNDSTIGNLRENWGDEA
jgi:hypothetical protein